MGVTTLARNESYREVSKTLGNRHNMILKHMENFPNRSFTARELAVELHASGLISSPERNQTHPRLNELVLMGKITVTGLVRDITTGRSVSAYTIV